MGFWLADATMEHFSRRIFVGFPRKKEVEPAAFLRLFPARYKPRASGVFVQPTQGTTLSDI
jgi:hypothetical protein